LMGEGGGEGESPPAKGGEIIKVNYF